MEVIIMGKETKVNFSELVSEANVKRIIEEEEQAMASDKSLKDLKERTLSRLISMEQLATEGKQEERREIRNEVIVDNLRLVTQVLKKYGQFNQDKFQNGCIGLLKAAETYDTAKNVPFGNYAAFCIETEIRAAFKRVNRAFEGKKQGFLDSLDEPTMLGNGDTLDKHETIGDEYSEQEFDSIIEEAEVDTLFYDIIIPAIEFYGVRAKDIDMEQWRALEIQYFIELSAEKSQRQRITFTEMAKQLGTTPQNIRVRHQKVMAYIRELCLEHGYGYTTSATGRSRFYQDDAEMGKRRPVAKYRGKKHKNR
jgi:RNA polymerase sigma factor (sigma-70 family)